MEYSKVIGGTTEECISSESGWTMYIDSPSHYGDLSYDNDEHEKEGDDGNETDDSMASDASSGPRKVIDDNKHFSDKKVNRQTEKRMAEPRKTDVKETRRTREGSVLKANSTISSVLSGTKVTKLNWMKKSK